MRVRAVVFDRYGPPEVLRLEEVERPIPKPDEILVKIHATTVTRTDCAYRSGENVVTRLGYSFVTTGNPFKALLRPWTRIPGTELAGEVVEVGTAVHAFQVGDPVFGVNAGTFGTNAEFVALPASAPLAPKPARLSFEEAAAVCDGGLLALGCLRRVDLQSEQAILIYGASGSIGTAAVQLAGSFGAPVTAVCNAANGAIVRSLGADEVIDYEKGDFTKNGEVYDVIFDAVGKLGFQHCRGSLKQGGVYIPTDGWMNTFWVLWTARIGDKRVVMDIPPRYRKEDVLFLKGIIEAGKYRAVLDLRYSLDDVVEATRYVETGQKTGNVVLTVDGGTPVSR